METGNWVQTITNLSTVQSSELLLAFASTVVVGFGSRILALLSIFKRGFLFVLQLVNGCYDKRRRATQTSLNICLLAVSLTVAQPLGTNDGSGTGEYCP
jgi:hypothetical protein